MYSKKLFFLILSLLFCSQLLAVDYIKNDYFIEKRGQFVYPAYESDIAGQEYYRKLGNHERIHQKLGSIKFYIINGNLEKAKIMLIQDQTQDAYAQIIKNRYLAIIYFIQNDFKRSQEMLTKKEMMNLSYTKNLCLMRTINYLILDKNKEASVEWNRCIDATLGQSKTEHIWVSTLLNLKLTKSKVATEIPFKSINIENEKGDYLKLFLKLSLYLGQQKKVLKRLKFLNQSVYEDPEIRELVGLLYYREGELLKAYRFIEDLQSPNSQNIKGNIYLSQKKYELAFAQFKLALKRKVNSQNSIERIIPLTWLLKQWDSGLEYLDKLEVKNKDRFTKITLQAAFKTQKADYAGAINDLQRIVKGSRNSQTAEVNQLYSYNAIMTKNLVKSDLYANLSCKNNDGINCWLKYHLSLWTDFSKTVHREDEIKTSNTDIISEYTENFSKKPLKEEEYISQKDIEELDNNLIELNSRRK
jgi:hypothetical protein